MTRQEQLAELARQAGERVALAERERRFHELQDRYYLNYEIGGSELTIRFSTFTLMTIPYSEIVDIEVGRIFAARICSINLSNGVREMCRIRKSRGWFRYVILTPREPKALLNAFYAFRSLADPVTDMNKEHSPLPPFLRSHDKYGETK